MKLRHALRGTAAGLLLAVCLTTPTLALTGVVDVGGSVLRVRKTASTGSAVLDQLPSGKQVEIVDTATNGWYGIQLDSVKGYVSASYIKLLEEAAPVVTAEVSAVSASAAQSESTYVKVTADALNVRTGPGTDYAVADELAQGKVVKVLGTQDGWYQIGSGYIDAAYTEAATYEEALEQLYIRVVQGPLNIRSGPGTGYSKVGSLAKGRCVKVVSVQSGWYQIEQGYVSAAYVEETDYTPAAASSKGQELANIALQYVGYSYVYGGARASALTAPALCSMPAHSSATPSTAPPPLSCKTALPSRGTSLPPATSCSSRSPAAPPRSPSRTSACTSAAVSSSMPRTMASASSSATFPTPTTPPAMSAPAASRYNVKSKQQEPAQRAGSFPYGFFSVTPGRRRCARSPRRTARRPRRSPRRVGRALQARHARAWRA